MRPLPALILLVASTAIASAATAAPYRAPGGALPIYHGGDNQASYPPLSTVGVEPPSPGGPVMRLGISCSPNPARGGVTFRVFAHAGEEVRMRLFAVNGRLVREWRQIGSGPSATEWTWDGRDGRGRTARAGIYFYSADAGDQRVRGKLVMLESPR